MSSTVPSSEGDRRSSSRPTSSSAVVRSPTRAMVADRWLPRRKDFRGAAPARHPRRHDRAVRSLSDDDRAAVGVYLRARGVQIVAKQAARGVVDTGPERRLEWLTRHERELVSVL